MPTIPFLSSHFVYDKHTYPAHPFVKFSIHAHPSIIILRADSFIKGDFYLRMIHSCVAQHQQLNKSVRGEEIRTLKQ